MSRCKRCDVPLEPGTALMNSLVGHPDFPGDTGKEDGCTVSASGPAGLVPCLKCPRCGWSIGRRPAEGRD